MSFVPPIKHATKFIESFCSGIFTYENPMDELVRMSLQHYVKSKKSIEVYQNADTVNFKSLARLVYERELQTANDTQEAAQKATHVFLTAYKKMTRRTINTPHPTEVFDEAAVDAETEMLNFISNNENDLFDTDPSNSRRTEVIEKLKDKALHFRDSIKPATKKIIMQEVQVSFKRSANACRSLRYEFASAVNALRGIGIDIIESGQIKDDFLPYFSNMLEMHTWSPGDNDAKSEFTFQTMVKGAQTQVEAMNRKYLEELGTLASQFTEGSIEQKRIHTLMWKLVETISVSGRAVEKLSSYADILKEKNHPAEPSIRLVLNKWTDNQDISYQRNAQSSIDQAMAGIAHINAKQSLTDKDKNKLELHKHILEDTRARLKNYLTTLDKAVPGFDFASHAKMVYHSKEELTADLLKLREQIGKENLPTIDIQGVKVCLLDMTIITAENFGLRAQKGEYRQSVHVIEITFRQVNEHLHNAGIIKNLHAEGLIKDPAKASPEELLEIMNTTNAYADQIKAIIRQKVKDLNSQSEEYQQLSLANAINLTWEQQKVVYFEDVLRRLDWMGKNPEAYKKFLGAETRDEHDLFMMQALADIMIDRPHGQVSELEVASLQEYTPQVVDISVIISKANANKYYKAAQPDPAHKAAGSDSIKSSGITITAALKEGEKKNREINGVERENRGTGSSFHRAANTTALIRTMQGIETRMTRPTMHAAENERVKCVHILDYLDFGAYRDKLTVNEAVVNIGNFLDLKDEDQSLNERILASARIAVKKYVKKYNSEQFSSFIDHCVPTALEKAHAYAARGAFRPFYGENESATEKGPEKMRAIGYGQVLNNAGWGAVPLYYDISEFMLLSTAVDAETGSFKDLSSLREAADNYIKSPVLQDIINRAVYSLSTSNIDIGWKFTAEGIRKISPNLSIIRLGDIITLSNEAGKELSLDINSIFKANSLREFMPGVAKLIKEDNPEITHSELVKKTTEIANALQAACMTQREHSKSTKTLCELFGYLKNNQRTQSTDLTGIMTQHNENLGEVLSRDREVADRTRLVVLEAFQNGTTKSDVEKLYAAHAKLRITFESIDPTFRNPEASCDRAHSKGRAAA